MPAVPLMMSFESSHSTPSATVFARAASFAAVSFAVPVQAASSGVSPRDMYSSDEAGQSRIQAGSHFVAGAIGL